MNLQYINKTVRSFCVDFSFSFLLANITSICDGSCCQRLLYAREIKACIPTCKKLPQLPKLFTLAPYSYNFAASGCLQCSNNLQIRIQHEHFSMLFVEECMVFIKIPSISISTSLKEMHLAAWARLGSDLIPHIIEHRDKVHNKRLKRQT